MPSTATHSNTEKQPTKRLQIGLNAPLHIRHESVSADATCRLLYISDIHLRPTRSQALSQQILEATEQSQPDAILLGGDLIDTPSELEALKALVQDLSASAPVLAVGGNHDRKTGYPRIQDAIQCAGGHWIHTSAFQLKHDNRVISIYGPMHRQPLRGDVQVLCAHYPTIWRKAKHDTYNLVLAGHLHGCQAVAFQYRNRLFPGALFYPCCFLSHQANNKKLVVSRGVSDLIPIRWRCPREVVLCHV